MSIDQVSRAQNQILSEQQRYSNQVLSAVAHLVQLVEESPSTQAALAGSLGNFRQLTLEPASEADRMGALIPRNKTLQPDGIVSTSEVRVSKVHKVPICTANCACKCHLFREIGPPRILSNVLGHGYVKTEGSFLRKTQCDTVLCKAHAAPRVSVQYRLPQWLASRMIFMWLTSCPRSGPEFLLRVPRVVDRGNAAFRAVISDVETFKLAITKGDCTPYDVNEFGFTIFSVRTAMKTLTWERLINDKIIQWLVMFHDYDHLFHLSNYPEYWNPSCVTEWVARKIWEDLILIDRPSHRYNSDIPVREIVLRQTPRIIDFDDYIKGQSLTRIHQIVCGLSNVLLDVELQCSTDIDTLDSEGRSALWYAVTNCRHDYVRQLLEAGADPNIGYPPFLTAVLYVSDYAITKAFLNNGANFGSFKESFSVDHWARIRGPDALAIDELLVKHGLDPNYRTYKGETILMCLAREEDLEFYSRRLKQLIELGSDIEITDKWGLTAIMYAVRYSSPLAFRVLTRAGARVDLKSANGSTILHLAVAHNYSWTAKNIPRLCELFHVADIASLDLDAEDKDGYRAFDLLRIRNGPYWKDYCVDNGMYWHGSFDEEELEAELKAISALEELLHYVQEVQGVPEAHRYPPLGEYCSRIIEEKPVPGSWPEY